MKKILKWVILVFTLQYCNASDNLALGKPADQTGVLLGPGASGAVDDKLYEGNLDNCAITNAPNNNPARWWVDLEENYLIQDVIIHSRGDQFNERLTYLEISVGPSADPADLTPCAYNAENVTQGGSVTIYCNGVGRFVHIERTYGGDIGVMTLCEVQVFGRRQNLAQGKAAAQNGNFSPNHAAAEAVDGILPAGGNLDCAIPQAPGNQPARWWVDLGSTYVINDVIIYSRNDTQANRLEYFNISVGPSQPVHSVCGTHSELVGQGENVTINCNSMGRFVYFEKTGGKDIHLVTLCEVLVSGHEPFDCSSCNNPTLCDDSKGCSSCPDGTLPPDCKHVCPSGTYGHNCTNFCSPNCISFTPDCYPDDGSCFMGCQMWWGDAKCDVSITLPNRTDENILQGAKTNSSIQVIWQQILGIEEIIASNYYYVVQCSSKTHGCNVSTVNHVYGNTEARAVLNDLEVYTSYDILVTPWRRMSDQQEPGAPYPTQTVITKCGYPDPPEGVAAANNGDPGQINITWNNITSLTIRCSSIEKLSVDYRIVNTTEWIVEDVDIANTEHILIISENGTYEVRLTVTNNEDLASRSQEVDFEVVLPPEEVTPGPPPGGSKKTVIIAVVVVVVIVVVVAIVVAFILIRKRKEKEDHTKYERPINDAETVHEMEFDNSAFGVQFPKDTAASPQELLKPKLVKNKGSEYTDLVLDQDSRQESKNAKQQVDSDTLDPPEPVARPDPSQFNTGPVNVTELRNFTAKKKKVPTATLR